MTSSCIPQLGDECLQSVGGRLILMSSLLSSLLHSVLFTSGSPPFFVGQSAEQTLWVAADSRDRHRCRGQILGQSARLGKGRQLQAAALLGCEATRKSWWECLWKPRIQLVEYIMYMELVLFFHILGITIPIDSYFSEGLKPPTRQ